MDRKVVLQDVHNKGVGKDVCTPPHAGFASGVLPKTDANLTAESSYTGVSTISAPIARQWHVLRCAYGREKIGYCYLVANGVEAFYPTVKRQKVVGRDVVIVEESRFKNLFFAYGSVDELKAFVYDNVHEETKHLRFYYSRHHDGTKEPLTVPKRQMNSLRIICNAEDKDIVLKFEHLPKFRNGQHVMITEGDFAGVEGVVARYQGQQRVGVVIEGLLTATTAYVPSAFLKVVES